MSTTLISLLMAAASKFDNRRIHWFWSNSPQVAVVLVVLGIVLGAFWVRAQRQLWRASTSPSALSGRGDG